MYAKKIIQIKLYSFYFTFTLLSGFDHLSIKYFCTLSHLIITTFIRLQNFDLTKFVLLMKTKHNKCFRFIFLLWNMFIKYNFQRLGIYSLITCLWYFFTDIFSFWGYLHYDSFSYKLKIYNPKYIGLYKCQIKWYLNCSEQQNFSTHA